MDTAALVVHLSEAASLGERVVGGKAATLGRLIHTGFRVPRGFCITVGGYNRFVAAHRLTQAIQIELGRKPLASMRWEEMWDAALRIRTAFLSRPVPKVVSETVLEAYRHVSGAPVAVRSSAPGEDSAGRSFAGLHESVVGVAGAEALLDAVRVVWASLWSDAALLYRRELGLDPTTSTMAVIVQELVAEDRSGVGFGRDPRDMRDDREIIEAVPGLCKDLVDGAVDPDRWILDRSSGAIVEWTPGRRGDSEGGAPILDRPDLAALHTALRSVEDIFGWAPDIEWTGRSDSLTLLQARPITSKAARDTGDEREWYLSLRPRRARLDNIRRRVVEELIPRLEADIRRLEAADMESADDDLLADSIDERSRVLDQWKRTYWDEFIPFAHGVRQLALYYNDAVKPADPYEFTGLLRHQSMIATERNRELNALAAHIHRHPELGLAFREIVSNMGGEAGKNWNEETRSVASVRGGREFLDDFAAFLRRYMNVAYGNERLDDRPELTMRTVLELADKPVHDAGGASVVRRGRPAASSVRGRGPADTESEHPSREELETRLYAAVGPGRHEEARSVVETARLSWRLRDDDNVLIGRLENVLLHAVSIGARRLEDRGRLETSRKITAKHAGAISDALRHPDEGPVALPADPAPSTPELAAEEGETPRQLTGQPAAPGWAVGRVRIVREPDDLGRFRAGEVLVCDAIQPMITHLVPLASAVVERRGGMLIHGAIIAREMGIPCVNGVRDAVGLLRNGDLVTVDGHLGIVTVGPPEFDLELGTDTEPSD